MKQKELRGQLFEKMLIDYASKNMVVWTRLAKPHFRIIMATHTVDIFTTGLKYHIVTMNERGSLTDLNNAIELLDFLNK